MKKPSKKTVRKILPGIIVFCTLYGIAHTGVSPLSLPFWFVLVGLLALGLTFLFTED